MNSQFASYVTSTAFSISLSRGMIDCLDFFVKNQDNPDWIRIAPAFSRNRQDHLSPWRALERRGLVEFRGEDKGNVWEGGHWKYPAWVLLPAGALMHDLLVEAGLVEARKKTKKAA